MIKFRSVWSRYESCEFNQIEAAELLGVSERTFRRWCLRFEDAGEAGLLDRRLGRASGKRVPVDREQEVEDLYRTRYSGFTAKHFHEHLVRDHKFNWGYTWTKIFLQSKGLLEPAKQRGAHRRKRPRRPLPGMMLRQDGSRHEWIAGLDAMDLIVTMDDATNTIYSAFLLPEEGTASTFRALCEVFGKHGLPLSLYTDRGSHYFNTLGAGGIEAHNLADEPISTASVARVANAVSAEPDAELQEIVASAEQKLVSHVKIIRQKKAKAWLFEATFNSSL